MAVRLGTGVGQSGPAAYDDRGHGRRQSPPRPVPAGAGRCRARQPSHPHHRDRRVRRTDQAADHRTAAHHHRPHDGARRAGVAGVVARGGHTARRNARRRWRQRDQHVRRSRHRRPHGAHGRSSARHRDHPGAQLRAVRPRPAGVGLRRAVGRGQPALGGPRVQRRSVLRRGLHALAQADEPSEHRDRWRCRRRPGARRLGGRAGLAVVDADRALRRHVPVDAARTSGRSP